MALTAEIRAALLLVALIGAPAAPILSAEPQASTPGGSTTSLPDAGTPNTRLMRAIWRHDHEAVAAALQAGASPNYVAPFAEFKTEFIGTGWASRPERLISALGLAAQLNDFTAMQDLIDNGADLNLHARASQSNLPPSKSGLDMTKLLILRGYHPNAQDITTALSLRSVAGWEDWALAVLTAPGVPQRLGAIRAGTDPDYQRLIAEQADEQNQATHETEAFERQMQAAQQAALAAQNSNQAIAGAGIGDMVCSKTGIYHAKYVAYLEGRSENRVELKIVGSFNRYATEFRPQEMRWDDVDNWTPCTVH
jgi:hypothetical protein